MVTGFGVPLSSPSGEAGSSSELIQSPLAGELNAKVIEALDRARRMPLGDERTAAMRRAAILGNAAEILAYFSIKKAPQ
ncbi:hypothetical protein ACQ86E_09270 [Bradyrhizobium betae]|uniref:hypothetical protein n=1 Tax=Bradyrhizobium betae TaxID=244734 RepID=UPI003D67E6DB